MSILLDWPLHNGLVILLIGKKVLQDARIIITESGYIPGQAFPTEQAQLEGKTYLPLNQTFL